MSRGVPRVVKVLKNANSPCVESLHPRADRRMRHRFLADVRQQGGPDLGQVQNHRGKAVRVRQEIQHVA